MVIFTLCIDPERGRYIAFSSEDCELTAISHNSEEEAVGLLMINCPGLPFDAVKSVSTSTRAPRSDKGTKRKGYTKEDYILEEIPERE